MKRDKYSAREKRRADKMRRFPINTCPASRHVYMMAEALSLGRKYHMLDEEPQHCAAGMFAVVAALWEARTERDNLLGPEECARRSGAALKAALRRFDTERTKARSHRKVSAVSHPVARPKTNLPVTAETKKRQP